MYQIVIMITNIQDCSAHIEISGMLTVGFAD